MSLSARLQTFLQRHYQPLLQSAAILPSVLYLTDELTSVSKPRFVCCNNNFFHPCGCVSCSCVRHCKRPNACCQYIVTEEEDQCRTSAWHRWWDRPRGISDDTLLLLWKKIQRSKGQLCACFGSSRYVCFFPDIESVVGHEWLPIRC